MSDKEIDEATEIVSKILGLLDGRSIEFCHAVLKTISDVITDETKTHKLYRAILRAHADELKGVRS